MQRQNLRVLSTCFPGSIPLKRPLSRPTITMINFSISALSCPLALSLLIVSSSPSAHGALASDALKTRDPLKGTVLNLRQFGNAGRGGDDTPIFRQGLAEASRRGLA